MTAFSSSVLVLSAPSGAGKSSLIKSLAQKQQLQYSISYTTRAPRLGEVEGKDYYFVTQEQFFYLMKGGAFVETTKIHGHYYGTPWKNFLQKESAFDEEHWVTLDIDIPGFLALKEKIPSLLSIFILPPSLSALQDRIKQRQPTISSHELRTRLESAQQEILQAALYDYTIINDDFDRALNELNFILSCEKLKNTRRKKYLASFLANLKQETMTIT